MREVAGDVLQLGRGDVLVQQCNCVTRLPHGLSADIARRYPYCRVYLDRPGVARNRAAKPAAPGTFSIYTGDGPDVVCLFAQYGPGTPYRETAAQREQWFAACLDALGSRYSTICVPYRIGCGLAGGDWDVYQRLLREFEARHGVEVVVCRKD
jgi:hypothetical protein